MKNYKLYYFIALLLISIPVSSQRQTITMKDGTIYEGFISSQDYKTGYGKITYTQVTRTIPLEEIQGKRVERKAFDALSKEWKDWAEENEKIEYDVASDKKFLSLTYMSVKGQANREYYVLVSGSKSLTAFTISNGTESCLISDIESIRKPERINTLLTDVDDIVQTATATYTGVILEQRPGVRYTIWNKKDKTVHQIDYNEVNTIGKGGFNPDYNIWEQTPYLERLHLKNRNTDNGLIVENGFGESVNFLFAERNGTDMDVRQYRYTDIESIERFRNPNYRPLYDIILPEGESRINRDSVLVAAPIIQIPTNNSSAKFFVLDPQKEEVMARISKKDVTIETSVSGISDVYIAKAIDIKDFPLSKLYADVNNDNKQESSKKKKEAESADVANLYSYTYETLFISDINADVSTSINGTTKIAFSLPEPGIYFVYLRKKALCWVISFDK